MNEFPPLQKIDPEINSFAKQLDLYVPIELDHLSDTDKMTLIRSRKNHNRAKAKKFFGSDLKIDVSLSMIEKLKLPAALESDLPLTYFLCFLIKIQGCENLFFVLNVKKFWDTDFESEDVKKGAAARIFGTFLENNQPLQVNAKTEYVQKDRQMLNSLDDSLFESVYNEIYSMLHLLYQQFESDELYKLMIDELTMNENSRDSLTSVSSMSASGSIYPLRAYHNILNRISYALDNFESFYEDGLVSKRSSVNRRRLLRRWCHNFCEERLQMDFPDNRGRQSLLTDASSVTPNHRFSALSNTSETNASMVSLRRKDALDYFV